MTLRSLLPWTAISPQAMSPRWLQATQCRTGTPSPSQLEVSRQKYQLEYQEKRTRHKISGNLRQDQDEEQPVADYHRGCLRDIHTIRREGPTHQKVEICVVWYVHHGDSLRCCRIFLDLCCCQSLQRVSHFRRSHGWH